MSFSGVHAVHIKAGRAKKLIYAVHVANARIAFAMNGLPGD